MRVLGCEGVRVLGCEHVRVRVLHIMSKLMFETKIKCGYTLNLANGRLLYTRSGYNLLLQNCIAINATQIVICVAVIR